MLKCWAAWAWAGVAVSGVGWPVSICWRILMFRGSWARSGVA